MGTDKNKKRYAITDSVRRRLQELDRDNRAATPNIETVRPEDPGLRLPDVMWGKAVGGITTGDTGDEVTLYRYDKDSDTRVLLTETIIARTYGASIPENTDVALFRVPGFWLAVVVDPDSTTLRRNWLGTLTLGYNGVVGGFWVTPTKALDGLLPSGAQWVHNIYKWDYGAMGAVVRVEQDGNRWIPLQQEYTCPPDAPSLEPLGACNYYDPGVGSVCAIMTEAACDLQSGGTWTEGGTC